MIRCIAVDDEPLALALIESYIKKTPFLEFVGGYTNSLEALSVLERGDIDLAFLDIQMADMTGLDIASSIDTFRTKVIFTTAFDQYALEGFRVDALDYLLKPISYGDFLRSAKKVQRLIEGESSVSEGSLIVKSDYRLIKVLYDDILYLESQGDYVLINLTNGSELRTLSTLKSIEGTLPCPPFHRVHRSFIVNIPKVTVLERNAIKFGKKLIPISMAYRSEVLPLIF